MRAWAPCPPTTRTGSTSSPATKLGTLYVGVTNSLEQRIAEHGAREIAGFTRSYGIERLVFFRGFGEVTEAIHFEQQLKRWRRTGKYA